jgi:hypothetical protein
VAVSGIGVAYAGAGFVLLWSGLKNTTLAETLGAFLKGQLPTPHLTGPPTVGVGQAADSSGSAGGSAAAVVTGPGSKDQPATATAHQALAQGIAVAAGHPSWIVGQQWTDWKALWNQESGWSNTADTRKTGAGGDNASSVVFAYGIPQARPYSKMPKAGWPPDKGGLADAATQIAWGIDYIASHPGYGSPSAAWAHEQANGWY